MKVHVEINVTVSPRHRPAGEVAQRYTMCADVDMSDNPLYITRAVRQAVIEAAAKAELASSAVNGDIDRD